MNNFIPSPSFPPSRSKPYLYSHQTSRYTAIHIQGCRCGELAHIGEHLSVEKKRNQCTARIADSINSEYERQQEKRSKNQRCENSSIFPSPIPLPLRTSEWQRGITYAAVAARGGEVGFLSVPDPDAATSIFIRIFSAIRLQSSRRSLSNGVMRRAFSKRK